MSLEELSGPILHLVLSIKEGHGFGFLQSPFIVVASTSNLRLETEPIQPCSDPVIRTDLAWETDKKSLRGFRTSNTPVKVECFTLLNDVKRDRIGYILLNIKSAQVVPNGKHIKVLEKCHCLIGVPQEAKLMKPELLLCLKITEANAPVSTCPSSSSGLSKALPESPESCWAPPAALPHDVPLLPIFRPDENGVQIGPQDSCTDTFIFTLSIDNVGNLSLSLLRTGNRASFVKDYQSRCSKSLRCSWISSFTATIPAAPSGGKPFVDVTTRLGFAANEAAMDAEEQPANSNLNYRIPEDNLSQWTENASFATETSFHGSEPTIDESKATVMKNKTVPLQGTEPKQEASVESDADDKQFRIGTLSDFYPDRSGVGSSPFISVNPMTDNNSAVHRYCLRVFLRSVIFEKVPASQRLRFRFEYPNGHVLTSPISDVVKPRKSEALELADIGATIVLHASPSVMLSELAADAVQVTVTEVENNATAATPFARAFLTLSSVCLPGKVGSSVKATLEDVSSRMRIGIIDAHLSLEDCGPRLTSSLRFQPHMPDSPVRNASPPMPLSSRNSPEAARAMAELQEWKEKQMEIFTAKLKEEEAMFLERASEMWAERKRQIEENLDKNVAQCRSLSEALSAAREELHQRSSRCKQKEDELNELKNDLESQYNVKFQELTLAAQRLDEGVKMKIILTETKCNELEDRVKVLTTENEKLRQELEEEKRLRRKLIEKSTEFELQSNGLNQQQVAKLLAQVKQLEEKLQVSMKSKAYFKEQWGRAIREANLSRTSNLKTSLVGSSLNNAEETFSPIVGKGLEHILLQEEEELRRDSEALELLRRQIGDVCRRKIDV